MVSDSVSDRPQRVSVRVFKWSQQEAMTDGDLKRTKITKDMSDYAKQVIEKISNDVLQQVPDAYNHRTHPKDPRRSSRFDPIHFTDVEKAKKMEPMYRDMVEKMLQFNPEKRIQVTEALKHPLFADFGSELQKKNP